MPFHARQVGLTRVTRNRHPRHVTTGRVDHADATRGVLRARFGILHGDDLAVAIRKIVDHEELADARAVEFPEGNARSVRAEAEAVATIELFLVDPVEGAVNHGARAARGQLPRLLRQIVLDPDLIARDEGDLGAVGRVLRKHQRRLRQRTANATRLRRRQRTHHEVLAARVLAPHPLTVGEDQEFAGLLGHRVVLDLQWQLVAALAQRMRWDQHFARAGDGIVAHEFERASFVVAFESREVRPIEPPRWTKARGAELRSGDPLRVEFAARRCALPVVLRRESIAAEQCAEAGQEWASDQSAKQAEPGRRSARTIVGADDVDSAASPRSSRRAATPTATTAALGDRFRRGHGSHREGQRIAAAAAA